MFNIDNYKDLMVNRITREIAVETIINNLKNDWIIDDSNKMFEYTKEEVERFIFFMLRNVPCLSITCIERIVGSNRIVKVIGDENKLAALILYVNGVFPIRQCTIKELLNDLDKGDILKEVEFNVQANNSTMELTFKKLSESIRCIFMRREVPVIFVNVYGSNDEGIESIKEILKNKDNK